MKKILAIMLMASSFSVFGQMGIKNRANVPCCSQVDDPMMQCRLCEDHPHVLDKDERKAVKNKGNVIYCDDPRIEPGSIVQCQMRPERP